VEQAPPRGYTRLRPTATQSARSDGASARIERTINTAMHCTILIPAAGSPGTLATAAFAGALAEGCALAGIGTSVVGLALDPAEWHPAVLGEVETRAPWLPPTRLGPSDRADARRRGIFSTSACPIAACKPQWRRELLLERALEDVAPNAADSFIFADTRSASALAALNRVARRTGRRVVAFSNEALIDRLIDPTTRDAYIQCVTGCSTGIWAVSHHLVDFWRSQGVAAERIFLAPLVVRPSAIARSLPARSSSRGVYLGNLAHREIDYLLEVTTSVSAQRPDFQLAIYGDAPAGVRKALEADIQVRGLARVVSVNPPVGPLEISGILDTAGVLLLPRSRGEFSAAGFPNKIGEYLASGRPVVVSGVGDIPAYLTDGEHALVVEPDDTLAFSSAVVRILDSHDLAERLGANGRRLASTLMSADIVARRLADFAAALPAPTDWNPVDNRASAGVWASSYLPDPAFVTRDFVRLKRALRSKARD